MAANFRDPGLTDDELRASPVEVTGSLTLAPSTPGQQNMAGSQPVVIASDQSPITVTLAPPTPGQQNMAGSQPVVIASDQSPITVVLDDTIVANISAMVASASASTDVLRELEQHTESTVVSDDTTEVNFDEQKTLYDVLDPLYTGPGLGPASLNNPLLVAPAGIDQLGQAPAAQSLPVVLANEQINDAWIVGNAIGAGAGSAGQNVLSPTGAWLDVSRYRSVSFQVTTLAGTTVTLTFEASNDGANAVAYPLIDAAAPTAVAVTSVSQVASTTRFFEGPLRYRFFRARISTALAGLPIQAYTRLSMAPYTPGLINANLTQAAGTNLVSAGVAGVLSVGGNIAAGTAPTIDPVLVGGQDNTVTAAGAAGALTRTVMTDALGNPVVTTQLAQSPISTPPRTGATAQASNPVTVTGPLRSFVAGQYDAVRTRRDPNQPPDTLDLELLHQILLQLKYVSYYLKELPFMLSNPPGVRYDDEPPDMVGPEINPEGCFGL